MEVCIMKNNYKSRIVTALYQYDAVLTYFLFDKKFFGNMIVEISDKKGNKHAFILDRGTVTKDGKFLNQLESNNIDDFIKCIIDYLKIY